MYHIATIVGWRNSNPQNLLYGSVKDIFRKGPFKTSICNSRNGAVIYGKADMVIGLACYSKCNLFATGKEPKNDQMFIMFRGGTVKKFDFFLPKFDNF